MSPTFLKNYFTFNRDIATRITRRSPNLNNCDIYVLYILSFLCRALFDNRLLRCLTRLPYWNKCFTTTNILLELPLFNKPLLGKTGAGKHFISAYFVYCFVLRKGWGVGCGYKKGVRCLTGSELNFYK